MCQGSRPLAHFAFHGGVGMGVYLNPGNSGFAEIDGPDYVDKSLLIEIINRTVGRSNKLTCVSRPRRFGKSYAARMLTAYYDASCDSHKLFDGKKIAGAENYEKYINPKHDSDWPAMVIELKWNDSAESAIDQILKRKYPAALEGYGSEILLIGISNNKDLLAGERRHTSGFGEYTAECSYDLPRNRNPQLNHRSRRYHDLPVRADHNLVRLATRYNHQALHDGCLQQYAGIQPVPVA